MKHYLRVYRRLLILNLERLLEYRVHTLNSLISSLTWGFFSFVTILLLTSRVQSIYGWNREELLILTAAYNVIIGIFHTIFTRNFERFSELVHFGQLDQLLVKPMNSQFLISFWFVSYTSLIRVILGTVIILWLLNILHLTITLTTLIYFGLIMLIGLAFIYSVWFSLLTITIWHSNLSNLVDLLYTVTGSARFPENMFLKARNFALIFLLPITLVVSTPTKLLFQKATMFDILLLTFCALISIFFSKIFWNYALRSYTSASS